MDELLNWRGEFPILDRTTYLISNSLGAMPRGVYDSLHRYADAWGERGVRAWEDSWWELAGMVADQISPLIGAASVLVAVGTLAGWLPARRASRIDPAEVLRET